MAQKIALVTGASSGIGKATAELLAGNGYFVFAMARRMDRLEQLRSDQIEPICLDVTNAKAIQATVDHIILTRGRIDVLVNNAGFGIFKHADQLGADEWSQVMDVNAKGTFLLSKAVIPFMKKAGHGHIRGVATDVSKRVIENGSLYCASKYAQDAFLGALRKEVRRDKIIVSIIYPGLVDTYFHGKSTGDSSQTEFLNPADVADAVLYIVNAPTHVVIDELMIHPISQEY